MKNRNMFFYDEAGEGGGGETPAPVTPTVAEEAPTPESTPEPAPVVEDTSTKPLVDAEGNFKEKWWETYESTKDDGKMFQNFKTPEGLASAFAHTKRLVGTDVKGYDAMDEAERAELDKTRGVPENAEDYGFKAPDDLKEGQPYDETQDKWFANVAKEAGLTTTQASMIRDKFYGMATESTQTANDEMVKVQEQQWKELEKDWGPEDSPSWKENIAQSNKAIDAFSNLSDRDVKADIASIGLQDNPTLFRLLSLIGANVGEKELAGIGDNTGSYTKESANARIAEIEADPVFYKPSNPQEQKKQKQMVAERSKLRAITTPGLYGEF